MAVVVERLLRHTMQGGGGSAGERIVVSSLHTLIF